MEIFENGSLIYRNGRAANRLINGIFLLPAINHMNEHSHFHNNKKQLLWRKTGKKDQQLDFLTSKQKFNTNAPGKGSLIFNTYRENQ